MRRQAFALLLSALLLLSACGGGGGAPAASGSAPPETSAPAGPPQGEPAPGESAPGEAAPFTLAVYPAHSLHPALSESRSNLALAPLLYEGLFALDGAFQPVPRLCQSHTVSEDGLTWTFVLRPGVTFSDGTPLTGELAAQALQTARDPASRYAGRLGQIQSIRGRENTVEITLTAPNGALPALLDIPIALGAGSRPLGTGPYVLTQAGTTLSLTARGDWWRGEALPFQSIALASMTTGEELVSSFSAGEVTLMDGDLTAGGQLGYSGSYQVWDYGTTDLIYLGFHTAQGLCREPAVRRAIALAVDRETIADTVFARHAAAAPLPVHPSSPQYDQELADALAFDPVPLGELGLEGRPVTLLVNIESPAKSAAANLIAEQLEEAGLRVTVDRLPWEEYTAALARGDFDLYLGEVWLSPDFDLSPLLSPEGALNYGGWTDASVPGLLASLRSGEGDARLERAGRLYRYVAQWAPIAPICFQSGSVLTQYGRLTGLSPVQGDIFAGLSSWQTP